MIKIFLLIFSFSLYADTIILDNPMCQKIKTKDKISSVWRGTAREDQTKNEIYNKDDCFLVISEIKCQRFEKIKENKKIKIFTGECHNND